MNSTEIYTRIDTSRSRRAHSIIKRILEKELRDRPDARILDVRCADGMVHKLVGDGYDVTGIEVCNELAEKAERRYGRVLCFDLDSGRIPLEDETFDIVVAADVIEHCKQDKAVLKDLRRLLRKSGKVIVSLPNIAQFPFRLKLLFGVFNYSACGVMNEWHLHFYTHKTMKKLMEEAGFRIVATYGSGTLYSYVPIMKNLIAPQIVFVGLPLAQADRRNGVVA